VQQTSGSYVAPEQIVHRVIDAQGDYQLTPDGYSFQTGIFVLEYTLPVSADGMKVAEMYLLSAVDGSPPAVQNLVVDLWNWDSESWVELAGAGLSARETVVPEPGRFVGDGGLVRLQLQVTDYIHIRELSLALVGAD
jgi:hypothetical protein